MRKSRVTKQGNRAGRHRYAAPLGIMLAALVLIGVGTLITFGSSTIMNILKGNNDKLARQLDEFLTPVVLYDPAPFDAVKDANPDMILDVALRTALMKNKETYINTDDGKVIVPGSDVSDEAHRLFGEDVAVELKTFGTDPVFEYNEEKKEFYLPVMGDFGIYRPYVTAIKQNKDVLTLTVGYIPTDGSGWGQDINGKPIVPKPDKYMTYVLEGKKGNYKIFAIKDNVKELQK